MQTSISPRLQHYNIASIMDKTLRAISNTDFGDAEQAGKVLEMMITKLDAFQKYLMEQQYVVLPGIRDYDAAFAKQWSKDQQLLLSKVSRLFNLVPLFDSAISTDEKKEIGFAIWKAFKDLAATWAVAKEVFTAVAQAVL